VHDAVGDGILPLLRTFYGAGCVQCAGASPLQIAFDESESQIRLRGEGREADEVVFPEAGFVEMVERSGLKPTETLIRVWLGTIYFDSQAYPWAQRMVRAKTTSPERLALGGRKT